MILVLGACAANTPTRDESGAGANTEPSLAGQSTEKPSAENEPERAGVNEASFAQTPEELPEEEVPAEEPEHTGGGTLIAYFSCTGTTKAAAEQFAALQALAPDANWLDGRRFSGGDDASDLKAWVDGLDFTK